MDISQSLGIEGLPPSAATLNCGALYLVASPDSGLAQALLFSNLPATVSQPLLCVSRQQPAPQQDTAWLDRRIHTGNLQLLSPRRLRKPSLHLTSACLDELARCRKTLQPPAGGLTRDNQASCNKILTGSPGRGREKSTWRKTAAPCRSRRPSPGKA